MKEPKELKDPKELKEFRTSGSLGSPGSLRSSRSLRSSKSPCNDYKEPKEFTWGPNEEDLRLQIGSCSNQDIYFD
jgi:hypothetical protein